MVAEMSAVRGRMGAVWKASPFVAAARFVHDIESPTSNIQHPTSNPGGAAP